MKKSVLFVCYGNACRSVMAEALARHYCGVTFEVASAGLDALGYIPQETIEVLEEIGISTGGLQSKDLVDIEIGRFELIVNLTSHDLASFLSTSFNGRVVNWHVRDPYMERIDSFRRTRDTIEWLITEKLPKWMEQE
ncbi:MAG: low molecular weight phosphatase family protein [Deltaproteobacteria bacterium]|nr:MAG: low molecular weight phosphatase family protein [Deltaproteobacteria bacterium]